MITDTATADLASEEGEDYLPFFLASVVAALATLAAQVLSAVYLAFERGYPIVFEWWFRALPVLTVQAHPARFHSLVEHSSLITAVVLAVLGTQAVIRGRRLQLQAGYAFAWLNMALIGAMQLISARWFDSGMRFDLWMLGLLLTGLVGFAVVTTLIWIDLTDRESTSHEVAKSPPGEPAGAH